MRHCVVLIPPQQMAPPARPELGGWRRWGTVGGLIDLAFEI